MAETKGLIRRSPELKNLFPGSLGEFLLLKWKELPIKKTLLIDVASDEMLNAEELLEKSIQVAENLKKLGVKPGENVVIFGKNSINLIVAQYGIILAGAVLAPLDPNLKVHELTHFKRVLKPKFVFCDEESFTNAKEVFTDVPIIHSEIQNASDGYINMNSFYSTKVNTATYQPPPVADPTEEISMILSSSGTTGLPKGVAIPHRSMVAFVVCFVNEIEEVSVMHVTQLFWASAILSTLGSIISGVSRAFVRQFDEELIFKGIDTYRMECTGMIPPDLLRLLQHPNFKLYDLSSLRQIITGGAPISQVHLDLIRKSFKQEIKIFTAYGTTEAGNLVHGYNGSLTYSELFPGNEIKIVDPDTGKALPKLEKGEICARTKCMMKYYINNEEATKEVLDSDGFYHTGDLGYFDENEAVIVDGRIKEIFKFRAAHIAPADMEIIIAQLPGVKDVGVVGIPDPVDVNIPVALVVRREGHNVTEEEVKNIISEKMASTRQLKGGVRFVDSIPKTTTGKIRRAELQKLGLSVY